MTRQRRPACSSRRRKRCVSGCSGAVKIALGRAALEDQRPRAGSRPRRRPRGRSPSRAWRRSSSCPPALSSRIASSTSPTSSGSSALVTSSSSSARGSRRQRADDRHALLLAARELGRGSRARGPASPKRASSSRAVLLGLRPRRRRAPARGASVTLSSTVRCGNRLKAWKTMPSRRRTPSGSTAGSVTTSPSSRTSPSSISSSRLTQRSSVDLPEPDAPISATASCSGDRQVDAAQHARSP